MNKKIFGAIGEFIDKNYLTEYEIEGYFGEAYLKVKQLERNSSGELEPKITTYEFFIPQGEDEVKHVLKD